MAVEDFTTYTKVDPSGWITVSSSRITATNLNRNADAYVYKDKGVDYFAGNFTHELTLRATANVNFSVVMMWSLTNDLDDFKGLDDNNKDSLHLKLDHQGGVNQAKLVLRELDGGTLYSSSALTIQHDTDYYLTIVRDESVGTYGTLYCRVYFDAARTNLFATLTRTLQSSKKDFRYVLLSQSTNSGHSIYAISGYIENLEQWNQLFVAPTITTQAVSDIAETTATGNGNITDLGSPNPTAHGVCWNTVGSPTIANDKTDEGAAGATGAFTSGMTNLDPGTLYYVRAYATNSSGTSYGSEVMFTTLSVAAGYSQAHII
ncbi:hypothetical protein LCGC14_1128160 [marine sediment metagenome]|uniref:Fibronectin type-III domain-containing protein n=1 Tax=marine sediment metagenome TaxID=412755 RepID=A0A0F9MPR8_9ZZZZ